MLKKLHYQIIFFFYFCLKFVSGNIEVEKKENTCKYSLFYEVDTSMRYFK